MCYGCWLEAGKPSKVTPAIVEAADLVARLYEFTSVGGNLHIVTDDWNISDGDVGWCRQQVAQLESGDPQIAAEVQVLDALEPMMVAERATVLALNAGYIDQTGREVR